MSRSSDGRGRRLLSPLLVVLCAAWWVGATGGGPGTATAGAAATKKQGRCIPVQVDSARVCLRLRQTCQRGRRDTYLGAGLNCVRRGKRFILVRATPAAIRDGRYAALPRSGLPTFKQALAAFDQSVADLPGVRPQPGLIGSTDSGTSALRWLSGYRDGLTPVQRRVFEAQLAPSPTAVTVPVDPGGAVIGRAARSAAPGAQAAPLAPAAVAGILREGIARLAAKGLPIRHQVTFQFETKESADPAAADTWPVWLDEPGVGQTCRIRIFPNQRNASLISMRQVLTHELTHCAQAEFSSTIDQFSAAPDWIIEGTADYVEYTVGLEWNGVVETDIYWGRWLRRPQHDLFTRSYDAVGFYALLAQNGVDVLPLIGPLVRAGSSRAAYAVAQRAPQGPNWTYDWSSTIAQVPAAGSLWNLGGAGAPGGVALPSAAVANGQQVLGSMSARGAFIRGLDLRADAVSIRIGEGVRGRLRDGAGAIHQIDGPQDFCLRPGGCACPDQRDTAKPISRGPSLLGLGTPLTDSAAWITIQGRSVKQLCDRETGSDPPDATGDGTSKGAGIEIRRISDEDVDLGPVIGSITSGSCRFSGGSFRATGKGPGWSMDIRIAGVGKPGSHVIAVASPTRYVTITGPGGPYSSRRLLGGQVQPGAVRIDRVQVGRRTRLRLAVGMILPGPRGVDAGPGVQLLPRRGGLLC